MNKNNAMEELMESMDLNKNDIYDIIDETIKNDENALSDNEVNNLLNALTDEELSPEISKEINETLDKSYFVSQKIKKLEDVIKTTDDETLDFIGSNLDNIINKIYDDKDSYTLKRTI